MTIKRKKLPADPNQLAAEIVRLSTEATERSTLKSVPSAISTYLAKIGRNGGLKGGKARAKKLSPSKLKEIAQKGARKRWGKD